MIKICACGKARTVQPYGDARMIKFTCLHCKDKQERRVEDKSVVIREVSMTLFKLNREFVR